MDKVKLIISDCHLSAGKFFEGRLNPHEDFKFDDEMVELFEFFSSSIYGDGPGGAVEVELFINGDFFDFLNVPYFGEFEDAITEEISLTKLEAIIAGHPKVMAALKRFASKPNKKITYLVGNHDADLFFEKVRERIVREWDPEGSYPSEKVEIIADRDRVRLEGGVEIHHGNQFEAVNSMNFECPTIASHMSEPVLNLPWGSFYVLKIVNRLKWEREHLHRVRPVKVFVLMGLLTDPLFTLKYVFLSAYYFLQTRFFYSSRRSAKLKQTIDIVKQESALFQDLEKQARRILDQESEVKTVIFGHTHRPMNKVYPDGKQYINTGTWTQMINLDWVTLGQQFCLTFALVRIRDEHVRCELRQWVGEQGPHRGYHY
ncbi:MAG: hypothetical protein A2Z97_02235 [Bdellovibrionales bacterium GWB1_52_6]|nr:MAG: hypothetical protein A2Z97_02235 [Bdellovibrionales bacterium GWB1_52_6]OFZ04083.1 MAG: hypothetical protein A2X97_14875 [Bdellovibrionales bacterium GWA1_52_35]